MTTPLIELRQVRKVYGRGESAVAALAGADLTIHAGEFVAIMGASGSGKSTCLSDAELLGSNAVCVLGATVRTQLFGTADPIDENIRVGAVSCRVIGLLESKGKAAFGQDQDDLAAATCSL